MFAFYVASVVVCDNKDEFVRWVESSKVNEGMDLQLMLATYNQGDPTYVHFFNYYYYGCGALVKHLFKMLNESSVGFGVKAFIRDELIAYGKNDPEFAGSLQKMYYEYTSNYGGIDIDFEQQCFENEMFVFPDNNIEYHLSKDLYDDDKSGFIGVIKPTYNDPQKLTLVFKELIKFKWVRPDELDTFVFRFTGQRKPTKIIDKIHWDGPIEDLLYLFKKLYAGSYGKIELFFDVKLDIAPKNYSAYADRSKQLMDLFKDLYGIKNA